MVNPGRAAGGSWAGTVSKGQAGHRELGLLVSWGESAKAVCADCCGYLPQEQGWALSASCNSCLIPDSFALKFLKKKKKISFFLYVCWCLQDVKYGQGGRSGFGGRQAGRICATLPELEPALC